jgi:hypothetical protein
VGPGVRGSRGPWVPGSVGPGVRGSRGPQESVQLEGSVQGVFLFRRGPEIGGRF